MKFLSNVADKIAPRTYAERVADKAKAEDVVTSTEAAVHAELADRANEARTTARTALALIAQEHEAVLHRASVSISKETRTKLVPMLVEYRKQPTRAIEQALAKAVSDADAKSHVAQGCGLDGFVISTSFVQALVESGEQHLVAIFHDQLEYSNGIVESAAAVLNAALSGAISDLSQALSALESATDGKIRMSGKYEATDDHRAAFHELTLHSHAGMRTRAAAEFSLATADARQAKYAAEYRRPVAIHLDGSVGVKGATTAAPVVDFEGDTVSRGSASNHAAADETHGDSVSTGFGLPEIDFNRI
jgi:hypothetical protein